MGSTAAYALALAGLCDDLFLLDARQNLAQAHAIDITEAQTLTGLALPRVHAEEPAAGSVDLLVVAASRPVPRDGVRSGAGSPNVVLMHALADQVRGLVAPDGLVLVLSNPVDILAAVLAEVAGLDPRRVVGYNLNDSVRFRRALARVLDVAPTSVDAMVLGEHGKHQVPLFSRVLVDGERVRIDAADETAVREEISGWFRTWSALEPGRSSGWCTATGVVELIRRMRLGARIPLAAWTGGTSLPESFVTVPVRFEGREPVVDLDAVPVEDHPALAAAALAVAAEAEAALAALPSTVGG